jgi:hypothetical protein
LNDTFAIRTTVGMRMIGSGHTTLLVKAASPRAAPAPTAHIHARRRAETTHVAQTHAASRRKVKSTSVRIRTPPYKNEG